MTDIFVFGSNLAGWHGKGAARDAFRHHGAIQGIGVGFQGRSYAIPTKGYTLRTLSLAAIQANVNDFIAYAEFHPYMTFKLTPIGCGLAGYTPEQIAPLFVRAPSNVLLPEVFSRIIRPQEGPERWSFTRQETKD